MEIMWFYALKLAIIVGVFTMVSRPFLKSWKKERRLPRSKWPWIGLAVVVAVFFLKPFKIDRSDEREAVVRSFDEPVQQVEPEIQTYGTGEYQAPTNKQQIERITQEH